MDLGRRSPALICVLIGLARLDQPQRHAIAMRPSQHRATAELRSVVGADHGRPAALRADTIQDARQVLATQAVLNNHRDRLVSRIIDDHQAFERASGVDAIE